VFSVLIRAPFASDRYLMGPTMKCIAFGRCRSPQTQVGP
jgi:hypothetical protein